MENQEGLVLQGCGGDLQEWVDGINEILAKECILKKGAGFEEAYTFRHDGLTCIYEDNADPWGWYMDKIGKNPESMRLSECK